MCWSLEFFEEYILRITKKDHHKLNLLNIHNFPKLCFLDIDFFFFFSSLVFYENIIISDCMPVFMYRQTL